MTNTRKASQKKTRSWEKPREFPARSHHPLTPTAAILNRLMQALLTRLAVLYNTPENTVVQSQGEKPVFYVSVRRPYTHRLMGICTLVSPQDKTNAVIQGFIKELNMLNCVFNNIWTASSVMRDELFWAPSSWSVYSSVPNARQQAPSNVVVTLTSPITFRETETYMCVGGGGYLWRK